MAIRLLRERNAEMVARLAANTYTVIELGPLERDSSRPSPLRLENISIVRTFRSSKRANEAARELLNEKARGMTDPTCQEVSKEDGTVLCFATSAREMRVVDVEFRQGLDFCPECDEL